MAISQSYTAAVRFYVTINNVAQNLDYNRGEQYTGGGAGITIALNKGDVIKAYKSYSASNGVGIIQIVAVG